MSIKLPPAFYRRPPNLTNHRTCLLPHRQHPPPHTHPSFIAAGSQVTVCDYILQSRYVTIFCSQLIQTVYKQSKRNSSNRLHNSRPLTTRNNDPSRIYVLSLLMGAELRWAIRGGNQR
jgi:hypothetical protein